MTTQSGPTPASRDVDESGLGEIARSAFSRLETFREIERTLNLFGERFEGWSPWRVMRAPIFASVTMIGQGFSNSGQRQLGRMAEAAWATVQFLQVIVFGPRRDVLVKTCRSALRLHEGGRYRDVYFDGLLATGIAAFKLEEINSRAFDRQASNALFPADLNPIVFTFWGRIFGTLFPAISVDAFAAFVVRALETNLGLAVTAKALRMRVSTVKWQARLYRLLLWRIRPRVVLVSDSAEFGLRIACEKAGICFIELQHGVFDAAHPDAVPGNVTGSKSALLLPDMLASRGSFWIEQLVGTRQHEAAQAVGNEMVDRAIAVRALRASTTALHIVFSSQGVDTDRAAAWLSAVANNNDSGDWRMTIKLHPGYDAETRSYDRLTDDPRITIIAGSIEPNVFDLLAGADLHLSISSACLFDAAAIGVRSAIIPLHSHERLLYAVDDDAIHLLHEPAEVWRLITLPPLNSGACRRFSEPGFLESLATAIAPVPGDTVYQHCIPGAGGVRDGEQRRQ